MPSAARCLGAEWVLGDNLLTERGRKAIRKVHRADETHPFRKGTWLCSQWGPKVTAATDAWGGRGSGLGDASSDAVLVSFGTLILSVKPLRFIK